MKQLLKTLKILLILFGLFTGITFVIYILNLDMKAAAILQEKILPIYDRRERRKPD